MRIKYSPAKFVIFSHFVLQTGNWCPNTWLGCQFPVRNTKWLKNGKFRKAMLSAFYNISQRNFGTLLILWCCFKLRWNFCLDQNFSYIKGKDPYSRVFFHIFLIDLTTFLPWISAVYWYQITLFWPFQYSAGYARGLWDVCVRTM
jgi:hypothetical protein